jgi:DNA-binding SARP family transcriptional activator
VEYRILGPLEVVAGGRAVDLGGRRQRYVLAALLLGPNQAT